MKIECIFYYYLLYTYLYFFFRFIMFHSPKNSAIPVLLPCFRANFFSPHPAPSPPPYFLGTLEHWNIACISITYTTPRRNIIGNIMFIPKRIVIQGTSNGI